MKRYLNIVSLLLLAFFVLSSCNANAQNKKTAKDEIKTLVYSFSAGRSGKVEITASKDALVTKSWGLLAKKYPEGIKKISISQWEEISSILKYDDFLKLESGEERSHYDGPDDIITMISANSSEEHRIINAKDSVYNNQLEILKTKLKSLVENKK